ncbi:hypothetical protein D3C87_999040 [compost metagenome]
MIHVHFAQGVVTDGADIGQHQQGFIAEVIGDVPHAPQQCQSLPVHRLFQRQPPGALTVMTQDGLVSVGICGMFEPPLSG